MLRQQLTDLWNNYSTELHRFICKRVQNEDEAWDIVQEAMTRLAQYPKDSEPAEQNHPSSGSSVVSQQPENLRALWYRIAGNLVIDQGRRQSVRMAYVCSQKQLEPAVQAAPDQQLSARQHLELLQQIVDELPDKCRQVFILRKYHDYDQQQIADELAISRRMVEKHLQKALKHCRTRLKALGAWPP